MARQITVGLPDDLVRYLDEVVASGRVPSRSHASPGEQVTGLRASSFPSVL